MISMYFGAVTQDISAVSRVCLFFLLTLLFFTLPFGFFLLAFQLFPSFLVFFSSAVVRRFDTDVAFMIRLFFGIKLFPSFLVFFSSAVVRRFNANAARVVFGLSFSCRRLTYGLLLLTVTRRVVLMQPSWKGSLLFSRIITTFL